MNKKDETQAQPEAKAVQTIHQALVSAQSKIRAAGKSGENTYDKYKYAMLHDYCNAIHDPMTESGLALSVTIDEVIEMPDRTTNQGKIEHAVRVKLKGILIHESGTTMEFVGYGEGQDRADKALYKAITGGKKYLIADIFNVPTTDDPETDSHEDFDQRTDRKNLPTTQKPLQAQNKAQQAPTTQTPPRTGTNPPASGGGQKKGQAAKNSTKYPIDDKEQADRGCINSTLVSELRQAVIDQNKKNLLDPTSEFMPWLDSYLDALCAAPGMENYKRLYKGKAQLLLDIPATAYAEILERVQKEPKTCKPGYEDAAVQAGDDGVA